MRVTLGPRRRLMLFVSRDNEGGYQHVHAAVAKMQTSHLGNDKEANSPVSCVPDACSMRICPCCNCREHSLLGTMASCSFCGCLPVAQSKPTIHSTSSSLSETATLLDLVFVDACGLTCDRLQLSPKILLMEGVS